MPRARPLLLAAGALGLLLGCAGSGSRPSQAEAEEAIRVHNASADRADQIVCRKVTPTGSHLNRLVCLTRAEWARARKQGQTILDPAGPNAGAVNRGGWSCPPDCP